MNQLCEGPIKHGLRGRKVVQNLSRPFDEGFGTDEETPESYQAPDPAPPPWQPRHTEEKSVTLAMVLAAVVPGLGHVYARRFAQGLAIFIIVAALLFLYVLIFTAVAAVLIWIWQVFDARRNVRRYNQRLAETGARPW